MHKRLLIRNARLVNEGRCFPASVFVEDEHIEQIFEDDAEGHDVPFDTVVDAAGCYVLPGVIDEHVHFREPGLTHKADIESESRAAAAGGVTTYFDMPNTVPQTTTADAFNRKLEIAAASSHVNYGFFFGATADNVEQLARLNPRKVCGVKLFMGASTGNMLVDDETALREIFSRTRLPLVAHCEDSAVIARNLAEHQSAYGADPDVRYHTAIRSEAACVASTRLAVELAGTYGTRLHVAHVSTAAELDLLAHTAPNITAEACVPHLLFSDADYARLGTRIKCNPSIKTANDRDALRRALSDGRITTIATDHAPHAISEKTGGAARAVSGMPMVQFSLVAMLELVDEGVLGIERLVELMCHAPARLFQIENRGFLREGYKADIVLVRPGKPWTLTPNRIESTCNWSPLEGKTFRWRVEKTFCNGTLIYNNGRMTDEAFRGRPVTFER